MALIDVSVPLNSRLPAYPGNTPFRLEAIKRLANGDSSNVSTLHLSAHTGTHVDAPRHFFDDRPGVDGLDLERLIGPALVVDVSDHFTPGGIGPAALEPLLPPGVARVLIKTKNSALWGLPEFQKDYTGVSAAGALFLVQRGVSVVGIDYLSIESFKTPGAPAHHALLGNDVIVIEGLCLQDVAPGPYEMLCLPLRVVDADGAPARVLLRTI